MIEQEVYMNSGTRMFTFAMMGNELDFEPLGEEAFGKLVASNGWTLGQITAIEEVI